MTSEKLKYVSLIILCAINLLNYMDRFTVAGKREWSPVSFWIEQFLLAVQEL